MNYKGDFDSSAFYNVGDVVMFTHDTIPCDNMPYVMTKSAPAGTIPHDVRYWERLKKPMAEMVIMFHDAFGAIPKNIDDEGITLKTETGEYLITVDDSGDDPELAVTAIEEEGD